jgi:hypothetical protein
MKQMKLILSLMLVAGVSTPLVATAETKEAADVYCTIRDNGASLSCSWNSKERRSLTVDDIPTFVDMAGVNAYMTVRSKKNFERVFVTDANAQQFKRLNEVKKGASVSEIARVKSEIFSEIEKRLIKLSDELDSTALSTDFIKYDPSVGTDKMKREMKPQMAELEGYKKNKDKACTSTPVFEQMSKANSKLQATLSGILVGFQTPGTCMSDFKVFKDKDGSVDLRQLDGVASKYAEVCKK